MSNFKIPGRVSLWNTNTNELLASRENQTQFSWGFIAAQAIGRGNRDYRLSTMYIEFSNVASPGDPVTTPTFDRSEGLEYYQDLSLSADKDFLRVSLLGDPTLGIEAGYEDFFTDGVDGNKLTFLAQTQGSSGFHGKTFSNAANSKVYGAALVATPDFSDQSKDVIFARMYYPSGEQQVKPTSGQVGITWDVPFIIDAS